MIHRKGHFYGGGTYGTAEQTAEKAELGIPAKDELHCKVLALEAGHAAELVDVGADANGEEVNQ